MSIAASYCESPLYHHPEGNHRLSIIVDTAHYASIIEVSIRLIGMNIDSASASSVTEANNLRGKSPGASVVLRFVFAQVIS
ncbi:MAG: hypothetical protein KTR32_38085 [Granulosicoccus sp.]|nr:hypothetical protein [Granulosicoccus sp.]